MKWGSDKPLAGKLGCSLSLPAEIRSAREVNVRWHSIADPGLVGVAAVFDHVFQRGGFQPCLGHLSGSPKVVGLPLVVRR